MKSAQALKLARKAARKAGMSVIELQGRGKGSHRIYVVQDSSGNEVARFGLTSHSRELSWTVLRGVETGLAHVFGQDWMEEQ